MKPPSSQITVMELPLFVYLGLLNLATAKLPHPTGAMVDMGVSSSDSYIQATSYQ